MQRKRTSLTKWAWLSVAAALITMALKFGAWRVTDSAGLLSDAVESSVNLVAAFTALAALWYALRPADRTHPYGHEKIEFFASAVEGALILVAAGWIVWYSVDRLLHPKPLESLGAGIVISIAASLINLFVSRTLLREAAEHDSLVLAADGRHLMTDVWTSAGVVIGLLLVSLTGIERLDPLIAIMVAVNIVRTGFSLLRISFDGLMDRALPPSEIQQVRLAIEGELPPGAQYHALRTRRAGSRRFVDFHLLAPGEISVRQAHQLATDLETRIAQRMPGTESTIHIEPLEDPRSWNDSELIPVEQSSQVFTTADAATNGDLQLETPTGPEPVPAGRN